MTKELILRNITEIIGEEELRILFSTQKGIKVYWGTAPTGKIHIGYLIPLLKIADFVKAGCYVKILLADIHAFMDKKTHQDNLDARTEYYKRMITSLLEMLNVDMGLVEYVVGSSFQLSRQYTLDSFRAESMVSLRDAAHAGSEVVKQSTNPNVNSLRYPTLQALDDHFLNCHIQLGGIDQRKIFAHSRKILGKMYNEKKIYLMNKMMPALTNTDTKNTIDTVLSNESLHANGNINRILNIFTSFKERIFNFFMSVYLLLLTARGHLFPCYPMPVEKGKNKVEKNVERLVNKMSASDSNSKIDVLDTEKDTQKKISKCFCLPHIVEDNTIICILEMIVFPILDSRKEFLTVNRPEKYGGSVTYTSIEKLKTDYLVGMIAPVDIKMAASQYINKFLKNVRVRFQEKEEVELIKKAYPKV